MMKFLRLLFLVYLMLGLVTGLGCAEALSGRGPAQGNAPAVIALAHLALFAIVGRLIMRPEVDDCRVYFGLSRIAVAIGFVLCYITGLVASLFIK
jgi:hypothetical protein